MFRFTDLIFKDFMLSMFIFAIIVIYANKTLQKKLPLGELAYRWFAFLPVGINAFYVAFMFAFSTGWEYNPLTFTVAVANFLVGMLAILSFYGSRSFRYATIIAITIWLWGDAARAMYEISMGHDYLPKISPILWLDIMLPVILATCLFSRKRTEFLFAQS